MTAFLVFPPFLSLFFVRPSESSMVRPSETFMVRPFAASALRLQLDIITVELDCRSHSSKPKAGSVVDDADDRSKDDAAAAEDGADGSTEVAGAKDGADKEVNADDGRRISEIETALPWFLS